MRTSNYRKKRISRKTWKKIGAAIGILCAAGVIFFFVYFKVDEVEVMGSSHYSEEEVREMVLRGPLASNSVLAPLLYTKKKTEGIPFVTGYSVNQINRNTICISVKEEKPVGCIPYLDSYIYFDRNGIFVESSKERDKSVPYFDGISVKHVIMDEELPIKGSTVLNTAVALSTIFQKNDTVPDHIEFDTNYQISLLYGDITVMLGRDEYLEDKMTRAIAILPLISGKKGILHLESVTDTVKTITFEEEAEEKTAEELEKALAEWTGGYDEEGDYTGAGEYDEYGNYVGPAPTEESLAAEKEASSGEDTDGESAEESEGDSEGDSYGEDTYTEDGYAE